MRQASRSRVCYQACEAVVCATRAPRCVFRRLGRFGVGCHQGWYVDLLLLSLQNPLLSEWCRAELNAMNQRKYPRAKLESLLTCCKAIICTQLALLWMMMMIMMTAVMADCAARHTFTPTQSCSAAKAPCRRQMTFCRTLFTRCCTPTRPTCTRTLSTLSASASGPKTSRRRSTT